jgi:Tol biopolymer transport system component
MLMTAVAAVAGAIGWQVGAKVAPGIPPRVFAITQDDLTAEFGQAPTISPDGRRVAYAAAERLWIRDLDGLKPREVPQSENPRAPFWSPDSAWLAWVSGGNLYKMPVGGGQPVVLSQVGERSVHAAAWGEDGTIYLTGASSDIRTVSELGGEPRSLLRAVEGASVDFHTISVLPGDRGIMYTVHGTAGADSVEVLAGGQQKRILQYPGERVENAAYDPRGYLVVARQQRNDGIWAMPFSLEELKVTGDAFLLDPEGNWPSLSSEGTLLYAQGTGTTRSQLVFVDREGQVVDKMGEPRMGMEDLELSWDGRRVLVSEEYAGNRDIWMNDLERGTRTRMTFEEAPERAPAWLPGDELFAYAIGGSGLSSAALMVRSADGTGEPRVLAPSGVRPSFRPGQPLFAFSHFAGETAWDIWYGALAPDGSAEGTPGEFLAGPGQQYDIQISPGGDLIAYADRTGGRELIYVMAFPGKGGRWQVSLDAGYWPRWSRKGDEVYFLEERPGGTSLMAVTVQRTPELRLSTPRELFNDRSSPGLILDSNGRSYDVHPDGKRFLLTQVPEGERAVEASLVVSQSWVEAFGKQGR